MKDNSKSSFEVSILMTGLIRATVMGLKKNSCAF